MTQLLLESSKTDANEGCLVSRLHVWKRCFLLRVKERGGIQSSVRLHSTACGGATAKWTRHWWELHHEAHKLAHPRPTPILYEQSAACNEEHNDLKKKKKINVALGQKQYKKSTIMTMAPWACLHVPTDFKSWWAFICFFIILSDLLFCLLKDFLRTVTEGLCCSQTNNLIEKELEKLSLFKVWQF